MYKPISEQIEAVKIKPEYELTGNQLMELKIAAATFTRQSTTLSNSAI